MSAHLYFPTISKGTRCTYEFYSRVDTQFYMNVYARVTRVFRPELASRRFNALFNYNIFVRAYKKNVYPETGRYNIFFLPTREISSTIHALSLQDVGMGGVGVPYQRPPSRLGYDDCSQQQQQQQQQPQGTPSSQQPRPQSRVGFVTDSRCTSRLGGLGYDDTGGGGLGGVAGGGGGGGGGGGALITSTGGYLLDQSDPRMYCTSGYCMGDTIMARGLCGEELELDMRRHIQACACTCNHMGYGNYMDYQSYLCIT
uniref:CUB domain-containing protein n=1 Tax=Trichogramma kaykai TaxID=54128 RepID=A0ABD2XM92_9HYME